MSYIGQAELKNSELKRFDVTGSTSATHVLSWTAPNEQSLWITINGVKQQEDAYSIAGVPTTITLTDALVPAGAPTGGGSDKIFFENGPTVTTAYTVTANYNAVSAGPVAVDSGINVTLTGTSEWVIV